MTPGLGCRPPPDGKLNRVNPVGLTNKYTMTGWSDTKTHCKVSLRSCAEEDITFFHIFSHLPVLLPPASKK